MEWHILNARPLAKLTSCKFTNKSSLCLRIYSCLEWSKLPVASNSSSLMSFCRTNLQRLVLTPSGTTSTILNFASSTRLYLSIAKLRAPN